MRGAVFDGFVASRANFSEAYLEGSRLTAAMLDGASFFGAHVENVSFRGSVLDEADFTGAHGLTAAQIVDATSWRNVKLPAYISPDDVGPSPDPFL